MSGLEDLEKDVQPPPLPTTEDTAIKSPLEAGTGGPSIEETIKQTEDVTETPDRILPDVPEDKPLIIEVEQKDFQNEEERKTSEEPSPPPPPRDELPLNPNSRRMMRAYKPVWWFLLVMGQMPFRIIKKESGDEMTYNFQFERISLQTIIYGTCFFVYSIFYLSISTGIVYFFVHGYSNIKDTEHYDKIAKMYVTVSVEKEDMREGLIPTMVLWGLMTVTFMGFITIFVKGAGFVQYYNHWNKVVQIMDIDPTFGVRRFFILENCIAVLVAAAFCADFCSGFIYVVQGVQAPEGQGFDRASGLANMATGMFGRWNEDRNATSDAIAYFVVAFFVMLYGIIASRCQIAAFLYFSLVLRNACEIWNERLRTLLRADGEVKLIRTKQSNRRVTYAQLLKDHFILVQLFQMTESTFTIPLISYYLVNVFSVILEIYFLVEVLLRPLTSKGPFEVVKWNSTLQKFVHIVIPKGGGGSLENEITPFYGAIGSDKAYEQEESVVAFVIIGILMVYQVFYTLQLTYVAAQAYAQAMKGFSILRRFGFMYCRNATERNFIHTLVVSFARNNPMKLTGGGYFTLNKALIAGLLANIINYVVFMYQFKPDDWGDMEYNWEN